MNDQHSTPPAAAKWLLSRCCSNRYREALAGDLLEQFQEGRSAVWFWRQVIIAILVSFFTELCNHKVHAAFALTGTSVDLFWWRSIMRLPALHSICAVGLGLRWPYSGFYEVTFDAVLGALILQPILAAFLLFSRAFRWRSMLQVFLLSVPLLEGGRLAWILLPHNLAGFVSPTLPFIALLISAWVGCSEISHDASGDPAIQD